MKQTRATKTKADATPPVASIAPIAPMEALSVSELPTGAQWHYEPKWDGFRCIAFRDGDQLELQSKSEKPLTRYFPEIAAALLKLKATRFILDGEIVVPIDGAFDFDSLLQRIHPAASRVNKLAAEWPATYILFDILGNEAGNSPLSQPLSERRPALEKFAKRYVTGNPRFMLSPATDDLAAAHSAFNEAAGNVDGIIAKRLDLPYQAGERGGMQKFKWLRSADCVVGGFRYGSGSKLVGSLLLGLYDEAGLLNHVGFCSGIKAEDKAALTQRLEKLIEAPGFTGNAPGGPSRWSTERSTEWQPLRPELVAEVRFDHVSGARFRHGTGFLRWRPDKSPALCKMDQLKQKRASK